MQSYFGELSNSDGIPLLEDVHVGQGDVGRPLDISGPLSQIAIQNSSPSPTAQDNAVSMQSYPIFGEEDVFMCGRCKQQFFDLRVFFQHKKEGCPAGQQQMHLNRDQGPPVMQLPAIPNNQFQLERKNPQPFASPTLLISPSRVHQPHIDQLNSSRCTDETLESSTGLNLTQNSQKDKVTRDDARVLTDMEQQSESLVNQVDGTNQVRAAGNGLLHSEIPTNAENIMLSDDLLTNSSPRRIDFIPDLHLTRFQETEFNQHQLNALGMSMLSNGSVAPLLQQIPTQNLIQQQHPQPMSLNGNQQQQQVYIHIPAPTQAEAQKMYTIQPTDATSQSYAVGLNLSAINVTPLTLTQSNGIYTIHDDTSQNQFAAQNLSKQTLLLPKDASATPVSTTELAESIDTSKNPPNIICTRQRQASKVYRCQYCSKGFTRTYDLDQHIRSHTGEKPFQCIVCGRAFAQKSNVRKHMETHKVWPKKALDIMSGVAVPRDESGQAEDRAKETDSEVEKHGEDENDMVAILASYCPYCDQVLGSYKDRKSHMLRHKDKQVYKCVKDCCDQTFPDLDDYVEHVKTHEGSMTYRCHHCYKLFDTLQNLGIHQYQEHLNDKSKAGKFGKRYQCKLCPSKFSHPEFLQKHMTKESHNHSCSFCMKSFVYERYLRKHINSNHSNQPKSKYKCSECGKMMRSKYYLRSHMLIHTKETPFKCEVCQASFNRKDNLIRHMVIHDPSKRYKCPFRETLGCQKEFNRPDKLKAHIICHNGIRAHKCSFCPKRYTRKCFKIAHEKTHTDEFRCKVCFKGFRSRKVLVLHKCRSPPESQSKPPGSRRKTITRSSSSPKTPDLLNIPDEPMYAIRSGSKRRQLRRNPSRAKKPVKNVCVPSRVSVESVIPSRDEASTEESEVDVDVETE